MPTSFTCALSLLLVLFALTPLVARAEDAAPTTHDETHDTIEPALPAPPVDEAGPSLRARLHDVESRSLLGTALYISSFVHLAGSLAGVIGAIPVGVQSASGLYAMLGLSVASFVGHVVTISLAVAFDVSSGARRRALMEDFLRRRVVPALEPSTDDATLVEALF